MPNYRRIYFKPDNMEQILSEFPMCFQTPATVLEPSEANIVIGCVNYKLTDEFFADYRTYGFYTYPNYIDRVDENKQRICCYLTNFATERIDGQDIPYLDIQEGSPDWLVGRAGISIYNGDNDEKITNLVQIRGEDNSYSIYGTAYAGSTLEDAKWHENMQVSPIYGGSTPINSIIPDISGRGAYPDSFIIDAAIPIFINESAAAHYIETGEIQENTCFNDAADFEQIDNSYFIRSWTYEYNEYKNYVGHDNDKHRLDIFANGNKVVGYVKEGDYYNIKLVASGSNDMTWSTLDGSSYHGDAATFNASSQAIRYNTFNQYVRYGREGYVKGGWWDTNIYIYKNKEDAETALEHPESVLPINPYDVDETPSPQDTGTSVNTESDLTSQTHDASTGLITLYESSAAALNVLGSALYTANTSFLDGLKIYGESPINSLISVYHCPIDLDNFISKEPASAFKVGSNTVPTTGANIVKTYGKIVALGSVLVNPIYNDFRDYTNLEYELHLPFSNPIMLDASEIMGKTLTIKATVDPYNLQIRYYIIVNSVVYKFIDASFGKQVAVLGNDGAGKARELRQDIMGITGNAIGIAAGMATGNPVLTANNVMQATGGIYATLETEKREPKKQVVGAFANGCGENDILYPYLSITETLSIAPANLVSVYGRPTNLVTKLGTVRGFTCAELTQVTINCTDSERSEIEALVSQGIII